MNRRIHLTMTGLILLILLACSTSTEQQGGTAYPEDSWQSDVAITFFPTIVNIPLCNPHSYPYITSLETLSMPDMQEPPVRVPFRDPIFGSCLVRVTDRNHDLDPADASTGLKNEYSRVQSFNSDGSLFLVRGLDGTWYVYSAYSLEPLGRIPVSLEPRWSAIDPLLLYFFNDTRLISLNLQNGTLVTVHDFAADVPGAIITWTRYEGSPSVNGRYWGLMAEDENWLALAYIIYDMETNSIMAIRNLGNWSVDEREIDSVTISPLGNYFLAQMDKFCEIGSLGSDENPCGLMVYDRYLENGRGLLRIVGHSDTALNTSGQEVFVYQDIDTDHLSMLDLHTGNITPLWPINFEHTDLGLHISGRAFNLPGWVLISTHDSDPASYTWMDDSVFAIELKPDGRVVRFVHTHSLVDKNLDQDYWAEPQASVNLDFTRILFTSNWGRSGTGEVEMYLIELPPGWLDDIP